MVDTRSLRISHLEVSLGKTKRLIASLARVQAENPALAPSYPLVSAPDRRPDGRPELQLLQGGKAA